MGRSEKKAPAQRSPRKGRWLIVGTIVGAVARHFTDPELGRTRRVKAKDMAAARVRRPLRKAADTAQKKATMAEDRAAGMAHEATTSQADQQPEDDRALVDKVRSEALGGEDWRPYTINVNALDGVVTLRGQVDSSVKIEQAIKAVQGVAGVRSVESYLHLPGEEPPNLASVHEATRED